MTKFINQSPHDTIFISNGSTSTVEMVFYQVGDHEVTRFELIPEEAYSMGQMLINASQEAMERIKED